jgi:hypothetical protein
MTMTLHASMTDLERRLAALEETVAALHVTLSEDRPAGDAPALVDRFDNAAAELRGVISETRTQLRTAIASEANAPGALRDAHRLVNYLTTCYWRDLGSYGAVSRLMEMGAEHGRAWQSWCRVTHASIESCAEPLAQVQSALLDSWSELADRRAPPMPLRPVATSQSPVASSKPTGV